MAVADMSTREKESEFGVGFRLGAVEQSVGTLKQEMGEFRTSLTAMSQGQDRLSSILLRMEAASDARAKDRAENPRASWRSYVIAVAAILGIAASFAQIEYWFFGAQLSSATAPIVDRISRSEYDRMKGELLAELRLGRVESAFDMMPRLKESALESGSHPQKRRK